MNAARQLAFVAFHGLLRRDGVPGLLRAMQREERLLPAELHARSERRLAGLLDEAFARVPHYRDLARERGIDPSSGEGHQRLAALPRLDKGTIREAGPRMFAEGLAPGRAIDNATSGSTGESLRFKVDRRSAPHRHAATWRFYRWMGIAPTDRQAKLWGARFDEPSGTGPRDRLKAWMHPNLFLSSYRMSRDDMAGYARQLQGFAPRLLTSYPSPLEAFAQFCLEEGVRLPGLRAITTSAEQLHEHQRELAERAFGVPVFNRYGSREFANVAQECERHEGLHIACDRVVLEVLDPRGEPCAPGQPGELVITDLHNLAMPFLRFRTGDVGVLAPGGCACGRTLPRLARLEGRVFELIRTPGGRAISGTFWPQVVKQASPAFTNFQVRQVAAGQLEIDLVAPGHDETSLEGAIGALCRRVAEYAPDLAVRTRLVDEIAPTAAGKRRQVVVEDAARVRG